MRIVASIFLCLIWCAEANAQRLGDVYANAGQWRSFDWGKAKNSAIWMDAGFKPYGGDEKGELNFYKNQKILVLSDTYNASLVEKTKRIEKSDLTVLAKSIKDFPDCEALIAKWTKVFGSWVEKSDNSHLLVGDFKMPELVWQWDLGGTRATAACGGIGKDFESFHITFEPLLEENKLHPSVVLRCSRSYIANDDASRSKKSAPPLTVILVPYQKLVLDSSRRIFGVLDGLNIESYLFTISSNSFVNKYQIDRIGGLLTGTLLRKDSSVIAASYEGQCERLTSIKPIL